MKLDTAEEEERLGGPRVGLSARPLPCPASRTPGPAGKTPRSRRQARPVPPRAARRSSTSTATKRRCTGTSARAASTGASRSTSTPTPRIAHYRAFMVEAAELVVAYGGSLSGEHGDGQARGELLPKMFGDELIEAFREFKRIWDPQNRMNPGKLIDAYPLRCEPAHSGRTTGLAAAATHFAFPKDNGSFAQRLAALRRRRQVPAHGGGAMCPSYGSRGEEKHSTRGRARLLFEMLNGDVARWRRLEATSRQGRARPLPVLQGLQERMPGNGGHGDLQGRVPVAYYQTPPRPRRAYAMGLIHGGRASARPLPALTNFVTQTPGIAERHEEARPALPHGRQMPAFARPDIQASGSCNGAVRNQGMPRVMLWPDTFNNHFHPRSGAGGGGGAGTRGLSRGLPASSCAAAGRSMTSACWTRRRRSWGRSCRRWPATSTPACRWSGLEPSCLSTFRDELLNLFPDDPRAQQLSSQILHAQRVPGRAGYVPGKIGARPSSMRTATSTR